MRGVAGVRRSCVVMRWGGYRLRRLVRLRRVVSVAGLRRFRRRGWLARPWGGCRRGLRTRRRPVRSQGPRRGRARRRACARGRRRGLPARLRVVWRLLRLVAAWLWVWASQGLSGLGGRECTSSGRGGRQTRRNNVSGLLCGTVQTGQPRGLRLGRGKRPERDIRDGLGQHPAFAGHGLGVARLGDRPRQCR